VAELTSLIVLGVVAVLVLITLAMAVRIVPQARAGIVERLGRYHKTLDAGLALVIPYIDRVKPLIDLREQVVSFDPQPVITEDNLVVSIDTVIYFQVTDAKAATYEIADFISAIEQLTVTTLRNVIGGMTLEQLLTSRDDVNAQRARRGDGQVGHPRQPRRAEIGRAAGDDPRGDGEADARRA
jgi:regulator of protease activity HflC (stomatin/prohibitin superfamily)